MFEWASHGFTVGEYYYQSTTVAGTPTSTRPTSGYDNPLFYVVDADNIRVVSHYRPYLIIAGGLALWEARADFDNSIFTGVTHSVVGGVSRFTFTSPYLYGHSAGSSLSVFTEDTIYVRDFTSSTVPVFTEVSEYVIDMDADYSSSSLVFHFRHHIVISDSSSDNTTRITNLEDLNASGSWTPVLESFTETGTTTPTGSYVKIGSMVYIRCQIVVNTGTLASTINTSKISGLPLSVSQSAVIAQGSDASWSSGHKGNVLVATDDKLYPETFSAQSDTVIITGMYETDE
jgi:hypothetical protein